MDTMTANLPQIDHSRAFAHAMYQQHDLSMIAPGPYGANPPYFQQPFMYDPAAFARAQATQHQQQHQYFTSSRDDHNSAGMTQALRAPGYPTQYQGDYSRGNPYAYAMNAASYAPVDPRFTSQPTFAFPNPVVHSTAQYASRNTSDAGPVPSYPRGPPRKPKQSGHALWVGNLPQAATVVDLKDHFAREATDDIESVFLIAKSNCAFVNYRTEAARTAAMHRFHDSRFHGVRLVCRLRRNSAAPSPPGAGLIETGQEHDQRDTAVDPPDSRHALPGADPASGRDEKDGPLRPASEGASSAGQLASPPAKVPDKYFIVKSLTAQDLQASVRNKVWATQSHNEAMFSRAYEEADNVYLIFSANKSGEYFGYARMASPISGEPIDLAKFASMHGAGVTSDSTGAPQSILTPATATAPKGRIIDDSARGTIFWEADRGGEGESSPEKEDDKSSDGQNWGRQFSVEWMSTNRLPFYRTRGLRNPWNANREVKIARDGTELEPSVARRLVQMFHRPANFSSAEADISGIQPGP